MTTSFPPGAPNWVDLGTTDVPAATDFYTRLFGWTVQDMGPDAGGYGMFSKDGQLVAGIGPATDPDRGTSWSVYFATADADATTARVDAHGGKVIAGPMDVSDQGRLAVYQDPTGAYFSVWQPGQHTGAQLYGATGAVCWVELSTSDQAAAKSFYPAVLGVTGRDIGGDMTYTVLEVGGAAVAGAMPLDPERAGTPPHWMVYFAVDDTDDVAGRALAAGAIEHLRHDSPAGRLAFLTDPQGGAFAIIKPDPNFSA